MTNNVKLTSRKYAAVLLPLFLIVLAPLAPSKAETNNIFFTENFDGPRLDTAKWVISENTNQSGYPSYGGSVKLADGSLTLSSNGSSFPFIYSTVNPFPASGDFEIEVSIQYTCIGDLGCGVMLSNGLPSLDADWHNYKIITIWAHDQGPETTIIYIQFLNSLIYQIPVPGFKPSSPEHNYKITYINGTYSIYVDSAFVGKAESKQRPNMIVLGNPPNPEVPRSPSGPTGMEMWGYWGWSTFKVNYISISASTHTTSISIMAESSSTIVGSAVNVFGTLLDSNGASLQNKTVVLSYTFLGANSWIPISSGQTNEQGEYNIQSINDASGTFTLRTEWNGDQTHLNTSNSTNLSFLPYQNNQAFFVESNSSVSALAFNNESSTLSFNVTGASGTTGFVKFTVAKSLLTNNQDLQAYIDGKQFNYSATSTNDSWVFTFFYSHSTHQIDINLPMITSSTQPAGNIVILAVIVLILGTLLAIITSLLLSSKNSPKMQRKAAFGFGIRM